MKKILIATIIILVAAAGYLSWRWDVLGRLQGTFTKPVCSESLLQEAAVVLDRDQVAELKPLAERVQQQPNFDQDPNCLYVLVNYYINIADSANARVYFDQLVAVYNPDLGFSQQLGEDIKDIDELRTNVEFVERAEQDVRDNSQGIPNLE